MLEKFIKKDKNEELEQILDEKNIEEQAKNLLQGILYKVEVSYKDYKKVKVTKKTKDQYIEELLRDIQNGCHQIQIVKPTKKLENNEIQEELEKNKFYIDKYNIITYPMEKKILYAIEKVSNYKKIVNTKYGVVSDALSNFINTGKNVDRIEPFRDFNGWSWTTLKNEVENISANLVYQTIRILLGEDFLDGWCQDIDGIIDYVQIFKEELSKQYNEMIVNQIYEKLEQIAIINECEENSKYKKVIVDLLQDINNKITIYENTKENTQRITDEKKQASKEIKNIEKILSQESRIKQEYERINAQVDLQHKIFSIKVLKQKLINQKQQLLNKIEECNYLLNPSNYIKEKNKLIKQKECLEVINATQEQKEKVLIEFIKLFLECFWMQIHKEIDAEIISQKIYIWRYFLILPFNTQKQIKDIEQLQETIEKIGKYLIKLAEEKKVIVQVPYEIMKHVFTTRIIVLEELYYKITTEFEKYYVQIFDENISEEKFEFIPNEKIKINKKIKIFI